MTMVKETIFHVISKSNFPLSSRDIAIKGQLIENSVRSGLDKLIKERKVKRVGLNKYALI